MRGDRTPESQRDDTGARDTAAPLTRPHRCLPLPRLARRRTRRRARMTPLVDLGGASTPTVATPTSAHAPSAPREPHSPRLRHPRGRRRRLRIRIREVADDNLQMLAATLRSELDEHRRALDAKFGEALDTVRELAVAQARDLVAEEVARLARDGERPAAPANEPALDEARIVALADERALHVIASQVVPRVGESLRKLDARLTTAETAVANAVANAARARKRRAKTEGPASVSAFSAEMESVERRVAAAEETAREARGENAALEAEMEKLRAIVREDAEKAAEKIFAERVSAEKREAADGSPRASETSIARLRAELNELRDKVNESVAASRGPSPPTLAPTLEATVASLEATVAEMESRVAESEAAASAETSASRSDASEWTAKIAEASKRAERAESAANAALETFSASEWTAKIAEASKRAERAESAANAALETFSARLESASATFSTDVAELSTRVEVLRTRSEQMESREAERAVELAALRETVEERPANEHPVDAAAEAKATAEEAKATAEEAKAMAEEAKEKAEEAEAKAEEAKAEAEEAKAEAEEAKAEAEATAEETRSKASASASEAEAATSVSSLSVRVDALAEAVGDELLPQMRRFDERVAAVEAKEKTSPISPTSNSGASTMSIAEKALSEATRAGNIADAALKRVNLDTRGIESLGDRVSRVERRVADAASDVDALRDDVEKETRRWRTSSGRRWNPRGRTRANSRRRRDEPPRRCGVSRREGLEGAVLGSGIRGTRERRRRTRAVRFGFGVCFGGASRRRTRGRRERDARDGGNAEEERREMRTETFAGDEGDVLILRERVDVATQRTRTRRRTRVDGTSPVQIKNRETSRASRPPPRPRSRPPPPHPPGRPPPSPLPPQL